MCIYRRYTIEIETLIFKVVCFNVLHVILATPEFGKFITITTFVSDYVKSGLITH